MKNLFICVPLAICLLLGCEKEGFRPSFHNRGAGGTISNTRPSGDNSAGRENGDTTLYALGVEYPSSYDWQLDSAYGSVNFRLVVFASQKRIMEISAGPDLNVSPDPDRNHLIGGHVYSDFATGGETIVSKDGVEIFRYEGEEMMCGIMAANGSLYTLGQGRSGKGLSFRKDGEAIISVAEGRVIGDMLTCHRKTGALYMDGDALCFGYWAYEDGTAKYYTVTDGKAETVAAPSGIKEVLDIRRINGAVHMAYKTSVSGERPVYRSPDGKTIQLGRDSYSSYSKALCYCKIYPSGDNVFIEDQHQLYSSGVLESTLWKNDGSYVYTGMRINGFWVNDTDFAYLYSRDNGQLYCIGFDRKDNFISDASRIAGPSCVLLEGGKLYVAITPENTELSPFIWRDGKQLALPINGNLIGLDVEM